MKRSEMINLLVEKHIELGPSYLSLEEKCKEILDSIEEAGMLPPSKFNVPHHDSLYFWEPEDEG
jgi:hypothetical protein